MKAIFYHSTLRERNMTITDKIVYSQTLYRSLWDNNYETFATEGVFNILNYDGFVPFGWSVSERMAPGLNVSRAQYYLSRKNLRDFGYFTDEGVSLIGNVTDFFYELRTESGLRGMPLIVYSYLYHKTRAYGWVDKYHGKMAEEFCISRTRVEHIIADLRRGGFLDVRRKGICTLLRAVCPKLTTCVKTT